MTAAGKGSKTVEHAPANRCHGVGSNSSFAMSILDSCDVPRCAMDATEFLY